MSSRCLLEMKSSNGTCSPDMPEQSDAKCRRSPIGSWRRSWRAWVVTQNFVLWLLWKALKGFERLWKALKGFDFCDSMWKKPAARPSWIETSSFLKVKFINLKRTLDMWYDLLMILYFEMFWVRGYLHFPSDQNLPGWRALERLHSEQRCKSLGLSNFQQSDAWLAKQKTSKRHQKDIKKTSKRHQKTSKNIQKHQKQLAKPAKPASL